MFLRRNLGVQATPSALQNPRLGGQGVMKQFIFILADDSLLRLKNIAVNSNVMKQFIFILVITFEAGTHGPSAT